MLFRTHGLCALQNQHNSRAIREALCIPKGRAVLRRTLLPKECLGESATTFRKCRMPLQETLGTWLTLFANAACPSHKVTKIISLTKKA